MIVGGGIIAKSMVDINDTDVTIFASGVSNSSCTDPLEFHREKDLLLSQDRGRKLVYFSTCSLSDGSEYNEYLRHKLEMEVVVSENFDEWLVLRLPTVVGHGGNVNNFFNFIASSLRNGDTVYAQDSAYRSLLDCDDIPNLIEILVRDVCREKINVCLDNSETAFEIVLCMREVLKSESEIVRLSDKKNNTIINDRLKQLVPERFNTTNLSEYNERLIKKYLEP